MTYSIVAWDKHRGELGVAAAASGHGVGRAVPWAAGGVGAVATQSDLSAWAGAEALSIMKAGHSSEQTLELLRIRHADPAGWQIGLIDVRGACAAFTGSECLAFAGHYVGAGYAVQANTMSVDGCWYAMAEAFEQCKAGLAERMVCALQAAEAGGGDLRGERSAALTVVSGSGPEWERVLDLRIDYSQSPVSDLVSLLEVERAYQMYIHALGKLLDDDADAALDSLDRLGDLQPEWQLWRSVALAVVGREDEARRLITVLAASSPSWIEVARRVSRSSLRSSHPLIADRFRAAATLFGAAA